MKRLLLFAIATITTIAVAPAASASDATVSTSTEAWYASLPSVSARPAGTLHVGATAGIEDSRTYVALDLHAIPEDAEIVGGTLTMPIDSADSEAPDAAAIDVCAVDDPGASVEGSADPPPPIDCSTHVQAHVGPDSLTIDLAPFAGVLRSGGLALIPTSGGTASWHVAIWGRDKPRHSSAALALRDAEVVAPAAAPSHAEPPTPASAARFGSAGTELAGPAPFTPPTTATPPPSDLAVEASTSTGDAMSPAAMTPLVAGHRYADSVVFVLPLVLLAGIGYLGSALTRPITLERLPVESAPHARRREPRRARAVREPRASD